jgi:UDP-N-acetylglucosamine/UDP-N-acetylgalactosamine diphosphorylase
METKRAEEFAPLKNATGADSPQTVHDLMVGLHTGWLKAAGAEVSAPVEISPLFALDAAECRAKVQPGTRFDSPTYLR